MVQAVPTILWVPCCPAPCSLPRRAAHTGTHGLTRAHTAKTKTHSRHRNAQHMLHVGVYLAAYRTWLCASRERATKQQSFLFLFLSGWQKGLRDRVYGHRLEAEWKALLSPGFPGDREVGGPDPTSWAWWLSHCRAWGGGLGGWLRPPGFLGCQPNAFGDLYLSDTRQVLKNP